MADLPACQSIWEASTGSLDTSIVGDRPLPNPLYAHELATGCLLMAEHRGSGEVLGFGATLRRGGRWFLADLFVAEGRQSQGVGHLLLDALLDGAPADRYTSASGDLRAQALYARAGLAPRWPIYDLRVSFPVGARRLPVPWLRPEPAGSSDTELGRWDEELTGMDRRVDLAWLCGTDGAEPLWLLDEMGARQGYALVQPENPYLVDPTWRPAATVVGLGVRRPELAVDGVLAAVGWAAARGRPAVRLLVPGPHPALAFLLDHGFEVHDVDIYCASSDTLFDPLLRLPSPTVL